MSEETPPEKPRPYKRGPKFSPEKRAERARSSIVDRELRTFTDQQKLFMDGVDMGMHITKAAQYAGYKHPFNQAYKLVDIPYVREELQRRLAKNRAVTEMTKEKAQKMVVEAYDVAKLQGDAGSMVRAVAEINKMCGFYATIERHVQLDVTLTANQAQLRSLSDAELVKLAGRDVGRTLEAEALPLIEQEVQAAIAEDLLDPDADGGEAEDD